jgi:hypothetical protein
VTRQVVYHWRAHDDKFAREMRQAWDDYRDRSVGQQPAWTSSRHHAQVLLLSLNSDVRFAAIQSRSSKYRDRRIALEPKRANHYQAMAFQRCTVSSEALSTRGLAPLTSN